MDEVSDLYVPVRAGDYTPAECTGRNSYTIDEKEYDECAFCRISCSARDYFKDPDSGLPLRCDMCESDPPLSEPMCVQVCDFNALIYEEREEEGAEEERQGEIEIGLESLINRYGLQKVIDLISRMSNKG